MNNRSSNQIDTGFPVLLPPGHYDAVYIRHDLNRNFTKPRVVVQFKLIGLQAGTWEHGVFPLYQCGDCSSTRSIIAILGYNRYGF